MVTLHWTSWKDSPTLTRIALFVPDDVYLRKVFQRDAQGRVTGFIDRRENTDRL